MKRLFEQYAQYDRAPNDEQPTHRYQYYVIHRELPLPLFPFRNPRPESGSVQTLKSAISFRVRPLNTLIS